MTVSAPVDALALRGPDEEPIPIGDPDDGDFDDDDLDEDDDFDDEDDDA